MTIDERLSFFQDLVCCNYTLYLWSYTPEMELSSTTCPQELIAGDIISFLNFSDILLDYVDKKGHYPFILEASMGLLYIAGFEYIGAKLQRIHVMGPVFTGKNSHLLFKKELDRYALSIKRRATIFRQIEQIPIVPTTQLYQYTIMFHYCITGEHITSSEIQFPASNASSVSNEIQLISEEHRGIWLAEQEMLQMFRDGNPDYKKALEKSVSLSHGIKYEEGDTIRHQKNGLLVLLTLCSRASIEGGLSPSISYSLNDYYARLIEECDTSSALTRLSRTIMDDYIQRVQQTKKQTDISPQIQSVCDYISMHPSVALSISDLAGRVGYTEYYFSHKFKKETGLSVADYVKSVKIEQAKRLLSGTHMSIQEISDELAFGSRSYFSTSFQKATGFSPSQYRKEYIKL